MQAKDAGPFLRAAYQAGVGGPGFLWFGSNAVVNSDTFRTDVGGMKEDLTLRLNVMKGFFGMSPSRGYGSPTYDSYLQRLRALPSKAGASGACNDEKDDDGGTFLWQQARWLRFPLDISLDTASFLPCRANPSRTTPSRPIPRSSTAGP